MSGKTAHLILKGFAALCGMHGAGYLFLFLCVALTYLFCIFTGGQIHFRWPVEPWTVVAVLRALCLLLFFLFEIVVFWLAWFKLSKLAISLAVCLFAFWVVCIIHIMVFDMLKTGSVAWLPVDLGALALITLPCVALVHWLSRCLITPPRDEDRRGKRSAEWRSGNTT